MAPASDSEWGHKVTLAIALSACSILMSAFLIAVITVRGQPANSTESTSKPVVAFIGDSFTAGSTEDGGVKSRFPARIAAAEHIDSVVVAVGGSGYVAPGINGASFIAQVGSVPIDSDLVVVYGSINDPSDGSVVAGVQQQAAAVFQGIQNRVPNARILVIGPSYAGGPPPNAELNAAAIKEAADIAHVRYVNALDWLVKAPSGSVGLDGIHPNDRGHAYLAKRITPYVEQELERHRALSR